jgi:hypothetical protein
MFLNRFLSVRSSVSQVIHGPLSLFVETLMPLWIFTNVTSRHNFYVPFCLQYIHIVLSRQDDRRNTQYYVSLLTLVVRPKYWNSITLMMATWRVEAWWVDINKIDYCIVIWMFLWWIIVILKTSNSIDKKATWIKNAGFERITLWLFNYYYLRVMD